MHLDASIYPLRIQGEGTPRKYKKGKINMEKSTCIETESHKPTTTGPLEEIRVDIVFIREVLSSLPTRIGTAFTPYHSNVSRPDYEKYREDKIIKKLSLLGFKKPTPLW